jgi:hypothetical protein
MMRILGGWIALTPELPVKLLFGRHVWDCAQHADAWGRRLPELRSPAQQSEPANEAFVTFMDLMDSREAPAQTVERVVAVYRVLKPHLVTVYQRHLAATNPVYEPPTRRILQRCADEERRHVAAGAAMLSGLTADAAVAARAADWERALLDALAGARGVTGDGDGPLIAVDGPEPDTAAVAQDLVRVPADFDPSAVEPGLLTAVCAHARAQDGSAEAGIVAVARIGRYRVVKVRRGGTVEQQRWIEGQDGWYLAAAEVVPGR